MLAREQARPGHFVVAVGIGQIHHELDLGIGEQVLR